MAKAESTVRNNLDCLNVDFMRSLVKQYTELVSKHCYDVIPYSLCQSFRHILVYNREIIPKYL